MGTTTAMIAEAHPEIGYLGVEVHTPVSANFSGKSKRGNLESAHRTRRCDPASFQRPTDRSLDGIHIFFPDPWPKKSIINAGSFPPNSRESSPPV
jgi:tRNA (guanine-N7-)-methyltransferase